MSYQIKLEAFEGPFDLMLHLIKKEEIDIYDIPVAKITEEYLAYIKLMEILNLEVTGEFLVMAGTLLYIKSRTLLPTRSEDDDDLLGAEGEDPRSELVQQLLEYKHFKQSAHLLEEREIRQRDIFCRTESSVKQDGERMLEVSLFELIDAFKKILQVSSPQTKEIIQEEVSVEEKIQSILEKIKGREWIDFHEVFVVNKSRMNLVATFLALLELIRLKEIKIRQISLFSRIRIYKAEKIAVEALPHQAEPEKEVEEVVAALIAN
ncbi:MAG: segregation/condensation protein A [bacterium]